MPTTQSAPVALAIGLSGGTATSAAISPLFFRLRGPEWRQAGLPCTTKAYELHAARKLHLVKDAAGRTGITAEEAARYFGAVQPLSASNKRDTRPATTARKGRPA